jgi:hypothetical protein
MPTIIMQHLKYGWFLCTVSLFFPCSAIAVDAQTFESTAYRYSAQYPQGWYLDGTRPADTLTIDNFPASAAVHAVHLPRGGAEIGIRPAEASPARERPQSLDAWINADTAGEEVASRKAVELQAGQEKVPATEVRGHDRGDAPVFEWVDLYFKIEGRMFRATLIYWQGNPNAGELRETLRQVIKTLRVKP